MQTQPQTRHPQLLLSHDALLSWKFFFQVLFSLIIFRFSSPHHLIKATLFFRLFQPRSHHSLQQGKTRRGTGNNRGDFYSWYAQSLTACSSYWQTNPASSETLFISTTLQAFPGRFSLTLSSKICSSKMHNDISNGSAKVAVPAHNLHCKEGLCREESLSFPESITVTLDVQRTTKQIPSRY